MKQQLYGYGNGLYVDPVAAMGILLVTGAAVTLVGGALLTVGAIIVVGGVALTVVSAAAAAAVVIPLAVGGLAAGVVTTTALVAGGLVVAGAMVAGQKIVSKISAKRHKESDESDTAVEDIKTETPVTSPALTADKKHHHGKPHLPFFHRKQTSQEEVLESPVATPGL